MMWNFHGKTAFITGGASGIGLQVAHDMLASGSSVVIIDRNASALVQADTALRSSASKSRFLCIDGDVRKKDTLWKAVSRTLREVGDVDFVINSAGILDDFMMSKFDESKWDETLGINLKGTALCMSAFAEQWVASAKELAAAEGLKYLPVLRHKPRVVVNLASMAADGNIGQLAYSASKCGIVGLTLTAAKELVRYNVRVHCVKPTLIDTPMIRELLTKDEGKFRKLYEERIPFGIGRPSDVSAIVCFLCSEGGRFMNGCVIPVNGGKIDGL
jgi:NAD(P)-dependent dehydrogenase (short-subunit alcohol dehydrogenase family)